MQLPQAARTAGLIGLAALLAATPAPAQPPAGPMPGGVEVLARGPVHEAYALPADQPAGPGMVAPRQPPEPIEELPPDQKPEGENVQWIPGYWQWDEELKDFIWVSGFWRVPPPDRVWVPGGWRQAGEGWQWTGGFWNQFGARAQPGVPPQAQFDYLPQPPPSIEAGPAVPAPADDSVYVPGTWVPQQERFVWRTGYWMDHRPGWVWTPACYRWTPAGCVFVDGYWDYPLADRGVLFPPVHIAPEVYSAPAFAYTPAYAVREECLVGALFVRRGWGSYHFGDYFGERYVQAGYTPWCGGHFNLGFGGRRGFHDPLFNYYQAAHHGDPFWGGGIGELYAGRYRGDIALPPRTLVQQNVVVNNVTNNTVVNNTTVNNVTMLTGLSNVRPAGRALGAVAPMERRQFADGARQFGELAQQRRQFESQPAGRGPRPPAAPRSLKLNLPEQVVARPPAPPRAGVPAGGARSAVPPGPPRPAAPRTRPVSSLDRSRPPSRRPRRGRTRAAPPPGRRPGPARAELGGPRPQAGPTPPAAPAGSARDPWWWATSRREPGAAAGRPLAGSGDTATETEPDPAPTAGRATSGGAAAVPAEGTAGPAAGDPCPPSG